MCHNQTVNSNFGQFYSPKFSAPSTMLLNPLWPFFHHGDKQNNFHHKTYCKSCVQHYVTDAKLQVSNDPKLDFGGCNLILSRLVSAEIDAEAVLMEALVEVQEEERPGDGAVEVGSDKEYNG